VYARILGHDFMTTWDDDAYVTTNMAIRGFSVDHIRQAFSRFYVGNYAPVQILSYMLDYTVWGLNPRGFHLTDLLLHAGNGILLYIVMLRLGESRKAAIIAGLIFICHPVQVEAVAWISQRKTLLSTFLMLVSWNCYDGWRSGNSRSASKVLYISSLFAFVFSMLTKATTVILPLILLAESLRPASKEKESRHRLYSLLPFILSAAAMAAITFISQSPEYGGGRAPFHGGSVWTTIFTMLPVYCTYLRMLFSPYGLSAEYEVPIRLNPDFMVLGSLVVLSVFCYGGLLLYRRKSRLFFWFLLFIIGFLPVSQIVPIVTPMNDRYFYLPLLGAAGFFGILLGDLLERFRGGRQAAIKVLTVAIVVVLAGLSWQRAAAWRNGVTLWRDVVAHAPLNYEAWDSLGSSYIEAGEETLALQAYKRALALNPTYPLSLKNIGVLYLKRGEINLAEQHFLRLIRVQPKNAEAFEFLGLTMKIAGNLPGAEQSLSQSLQLEPKRSSALILLSQIYVMRKDFSKARGFLLRAQQFEGPTADNETGLATVEAGLGNMDEALFHLENVLRYRRGNIADIQKDPAFESLRSTRQYRELMGRYGVVP
jgi:Flp pilus assembly protein TadD